MHKDFLLCLPNEAVPFGEAVRKGIVCLTAWGSWLVTCIKLFCLTLFHHMQMRSHLRVMILCAPIFNPQTSRCSSGISTNSWHFTPRKGTPICRFCCSFQWELSQSTIHSDFLFLYSSSVHLIPASSCGVATPRTPISAKPRKGLRWMGPCVRQGRWELVPWVPTCPCASPVFVCSWGCSPQNQEGKEEETVWRTWGLLGCGENSWVQVECWALAQLVRAWCY